MANVHLWAKMVADFHECGGDSMTEKLKTFAHTHIITVEDEANVEWQDPDEGFSAPIVTQTFRVIVDGELVHEGARFFGSELVDPTHLGGLGGHWETIRVDYEKDPAESVLEELGIEIPSPSAPPWRKEMDGV